MDKELLIKKIMEKVMEELKNSENKPVNPKEENEYVVNFLGIDEGYKTELSKKVKVIDNLDLRSQWNSVARNNYNNKVLISTLCIDGLISIAQGKKNFVIDALLNGGEVYVLEEGIAYKQYIEPKMLIKMYDEYLNKIKGFGVKVVKKEDFVEMFSKKESVYIHGIITESKLKALGIKNKRIILSENNKITSLAQDYIKQNNIEVHYERGQ